MKKNQNPEKNDRDLAIGYFLTVGINILVGTFGSFAIIGKYNPNASSIFEILVPSLHTSIIELLIFLHQICLLSIIWYKCQSLLEYILLKRISTRHSYFFHGSNIIFAISFIIAALLNPNSTDIMAFQGAICCFSLIYLFPIWVDLKCLYGKRKTEVLIDQNQIEVEIGEGGDDVHPCGEGHNLLSSNANVYLRLAVHALLMLYGVSVLVINFVGIFVEI